MPKEWHKKNIKERVCLTTGQAPRFYCELDVKEFGLIQTSEGIFKVIVHGPEQIKVERA